jgi:homoserine/homoserine lactone efflux protein
LRASSIELAHVSGKSGTRNRTPFSHFGEGMILSLSNPKAVLFFVSLFPQFIDSAAPYVPKFLSLSISFCVLLCMIHAAYAVFFTYSVKSKLMASGGFTIINRVGGICFLGFAVMILYTTIRALFL